MRTFILHSLMAAAISVSSAFAVAAETQTAPAAQVVASVVPEHVNLI